MSRKTWFSITNTAAAIEVSIHDEIGAWGISAKDFLTTLKSQPQNLPLNLSIHSPGGEVFDGWAIYNALKARTAPVNVKIEGLAASMASVIAMAGSTISMPRNAYLMIHNPMGVAIGEAADMRDLATLLDKLRDGIVNAYESRTGLPRDEIINLMDAETWMDGADALARGFVDNNSDAVALAAAAFDTRKFINMPTAAITPAAEIEPISPTVIDPFAVEPSSPVEDQPTEIIPAAPVEPTAPEAKGFLERIAAAFSGDVAVKAELATARADVASRDIEVAALKAKLTAAEAKATQFDALVTQVTQLEAAAKTTGQAAAEIATAHGLKPDAVAALPSPSDDAGADIVAQFEAITDPAAKRDFYKKHKASLRKFSFN